MALSLLINNPPSNLFLPVILLSLIRQPTKLGAPAPNRIALSETQSAILWMYVTKKRWILNVGGVNHPIERPGKLLFTYVNRSYVVDT